MKRRNSSAKNLKIKTVLLAAVSLILVALMAVTATASWIEDVSQVEFKTNDDSQETPVHIGDNILKADAVMKSNPSGSTEVNLGDYFNKSGDMHLSPCYGDGENFYFPVVSGTNGATGYRTGTKDDANVNYLSATFRIVSEGASTAYWFEKSGANHDTPYVTFKDGGANGDAVSGLEQYLRCSVTIDGATTVYALNSNGKFYTLVSDTPTQQDGKRIDQYTYYTEQFNSSTKLPTSANSSLANQGTGDNLNGNTLFNVNQFVSSNKSTVKTVTVKIWLEYSSATGTSDADLASLNLNFVSSWAKTRRIFVKDETVHQQGYTQAKWLSHNGTSDNTAGLFWVLNNEVHYQLTRVSSNSQYYYVDIPAVYNNVQARLSRRNKTTWSGSSEWDGWDTTFPNTFHSETFTVYSTNFGTWEDASKVHSVYIVNSTLFSNMYDYMWDSKSVISGQTDVGGQTAKVVKNAEWPGIKMTAKMATKTDTPGGGQGLDTYVFFYNSDYDRIIFNDGDYHEGVNQEYQTQDLWLTDNQGNPLDLVGGTFDMATLTWFHTNPSKNDWTTKMPSYRNRNTYIYGEFSTNHQWKKTMFAYGGEYSGTNGNAFKDSSSTHMLCKIYNKTNQVSEYEFLLYLDGKQYGAWKDGDKRVTPQSNYSVDGVSIPNEYGLTDDDDHRSNFRMVGVPAKTVIRIYLDTSEFKLYFRTGEN